MDAVFSRFDSYDFDADQRFQDGLKTLKSGDEANLLDLKLFFYNRYVFTDKIHPYPAGSTPIYSVHMEFYLSGLVLIIILCYIITVIILFLELI